MADILFVTWDGGGNVPPAVGIADELRRAATACASSGHAGQREALTTAGLRRSSPPATPGRSPSRDRQLAARAAGLLRRPRHGPRPPRRGRRSGPPTWSSSTA